jgi:MoxR-like ATPase
MSSSFGSDTQSTAMIEFTCQSCGRLLRVPQSAAGRQVKCPQCSAVQAVNVVPPINDPPAQAPVTSISPPPSVDSWATPPATAPLAQVTPVSPPPSMAAPQQRENYIGRDTSTKRLFDRITAEISKLYVGQDELVLGALVALFSSGHVLIESVPGLGKTLFVRTLGQVLGCKIGRIQFTADLMPSDITGAPIFDMKQQEFRFRPGPVFTQFLLADEINRSPAKTHAALLEIMQEYRVTIDGVSHTLERPFLVLATQNPIESEGTYNLPEAQLDRFMFKLLAEYPREQEEAEILRLHSQQVDINQRLHQEVQTITSPEEIMRVTLENAQVRVEQKLLDYINKVVRLTRKWPQFHMGASPRAGIALVQAARTLAAFYGRDYAVPDDVQQIALPALRHRVSLTAEAEVEGQNVDDLLREMIRSVEVPRL